MSEIESTNAPDLRELEERVARWARNTLGSRILYSREERALRLVEEAMELAQAEDVDFQKVVGLAVRVWGRPPGTPVAEFGGVAVCVLAYAHATGLGLSAAIRTEVERVESLDPAVVRRKHGEKAALGLGEPVDDPDPERLGE